MLTPTPGERLTDRPAVVLLFFFMIMLASEAGKALLQVAGNALLPAKHTYAHILLVFVYSTVATIILVLLYCLLVERRTLTSLGLSWRGAAGEYAVGLIGGVLLFGCAVLLCVGTGVMTVTPAAREVAWGLWFLFLGGFLLQGMAEELLCRSFLMVSLTRGWPLWAAAVGNALLFSLLHTANPGVGVIALINIFLFGLFASMLTLRRGSIWMVGALHSAWNFVQGNLFGIPVSGIRGLPSPLSSTMRDGVWPRLVGGGAFGLEGGLAVTVVLALACLAVLFSRTKASARAE